MFSVVIKSRLFLFGFLVFFRKMFFRHIFRLQFLLIILAILIGFYHDQVKEVLNKILSNNIYSNLPDSQAYRKDESGIFLFTKEELAKFNGENEQPLYLGLLGSVYDVSKGAKHYGIGCSYHFFVGRDASVAFITGDFESFIEDKADDVLSLKSNDLLSLDNWKKFYDKDYVYKGKLIGRFYDQSGEKTKYHHKYLALVEQAKEEKANVAELRNKYPDCNIEWSAELGTRVWCTTNSGNGKERQWAGYPRKLFELGKEDYRCACIRKEDLKTNEVMIKPYDNCAEFSKECFYKLD